MPITDPKTILRTTKADAGGRLPVARLALAFGRLDPVNARGVDNIDETMSHFDGLAEDVRGLLAGYAGQEDPAEAAISALNEAILTRAGYRGDTETYDELENANLFRVVERRAGLPVALGLIYMQVGRLAGLSVDGIGFPGHFMIRIDHGGTRTIIDPFYGGVTRDASALRDLLKTFVGVDAELQPAHYDRVDDSAVLIRLQNNIKARLLGDGNPTAAAQVVETMLMIKPSDAGLWREAGMIHAQAGNLRAAIAALANFTDLETRADRRAPVEALIADLQRKLH